MTQTDSQWQRMATIAELVGRSSARPGRTALMKWLYFLKTLRGVPLDYHFRLYAYGPFDATALEDLDYATSLKAVKSSVVYFHGGYAYELEPGPESEWLRAQAGDFLADHDRSVRWVIEKFQNRSAADLELLATLVYADRAAIEKKEKLNIAKLAAKVQEIKPRRSGTDIRRLAEQLAADDLLESLR